MAERNALDELKIKLTSFPHFLQFDIIAKIKHSRCQNILERLQSEKEKQPNHEEDQYKSDNFISLLYFRLGQREEAFEANAMVRQEFPKNITALVHLVYMQMMAGYEFEANKNVKVLIGYKQDKDFDKLIATALAEHGYCLARIAPRFYKSAVEYYEEALKSVPLNFVWKFGCALSSRRCLNVTKGLKMTADELRFYCQNSFKHLSEIISKCGVPLLLAKAWVELGELTFLLKRPHYPLTRELVNSLGLKIISTPEQCFDKALEIHDVKNDEFILERCGKFLRLVRHPTKYNDTLLECHSYLMQAISLRPTSYSCEHVARILIKLAESNTNDVGESSPGFQIPTLPHHKRKRSDHTVLVTGASNVTTLAGDFRRSLAFHEPTKSPSQYGCQKETSHINHRQQQATIRSNFKQARNSPRYVIRLNSEDAHVKEAELFLKQSIEISKGGNKSAIYCLGLMYRQVGDHQSAIEQFRRITSDTDSPPFQKTNAYEQRGYCLLDLIQDSECKPSERESYIQESQMMMMMSIDYAVILISETHTMKSEDIRDWQAYPTLKQLLASGTQDVELRKKFADLCARIGDHRESLVFYDQLLHTNPEDPDVLHGIIENLVRLHQFRSAQACLRLLLCTSEGHRMVEDYPHLVNQVYLTTVKHLMMSEETDQDKDQIKLSCRSLFQHRHGSTYDEDDMNWDVFILDDPDQTDAEATAIQSWLKETCGLSVTRNDEEVPAGTISFSGEAMLMTSSRCLVVVLGTGDMKRQENLVAIALSNQVPENTMPVVVVPVLTSNRDLPLTLRGNQPVNLTQDHLSPDVLLSCFMALLGLDFNTFQWLV